jgi:hypothetical protein
MPNRGKHGKARAAAEAREDIMSSAALSAMSAGVVNAMAEQAAHTPRSNGDATFIEVYARTLPELVKKALSARAQAVH